MDSSDQPGLLPPPGVTPNFDDPFTLQPYNILTIAICFALTTPAVAARLYTRYFIIKSVGWEDYTIFLAWLCFIPLVATSLIIGEHGGGSHQWNVSQRNVQIIAYYSNYQDIVYSPTIAFTKLSIMLLILRIFVTRQRTALFWALQALMYLNSIFYLIYLIIPIFLCMPRRKIWTPSLPGHCLNPSALYTASAAFNVVSDVGMLVIPSYSIWHLQITMKRKVGILAVFGTGSFACLSSIFRIVSLARLLRTQDRTYYQVPGSYWTHAEIACGILCSCLPILPRLIQHISSTPTPSPHKSSASTASSQRTAVGEVKKRIFPGGPQVGEGGLEDKLEEREGEGV